MPGESPFDFDFSTALQKIVGLKPDDSESALSQLSIDQLIDLIDALKAGDKRRVMHLIHPSHDRLPREMSPMQRDVQTESLIDEGFNYTLQAASDLIREKIMDWMDDHGYAFEAEPTGLLHVKCERRDDAYRIGRALETLTGRYLRDDD